MTISQSVPATSYYRDTTSAASRSRQAKASSALPTGASEALLAEASVATAATPGPTATPTSATTTAVTQAAQPAAPPANAVPDLRRMQLFGSGGFLTPAVPTSGQASEAPATAMPMSMSERLRALNTMRSIEASAESSSNPVPQALVEAMGPALDASGRTGSSVDVMA